MTERIPLGNAQYWWSIEGRIGEVFTVKNPKEDPNKFSAGKWVLEDGHYIIKEVINGSYDGQPNHYINVERIV